MQQVTITYLNILNYLYSSSYFKYLRVFFFPRLTYNLVFVLDYLIVFLSHSNRLLGRDGEGTSCIVISSHVREM